MQVLVCPSVKLATPIQPDVPTSLSDTTYLGNSMVMGKRSSVIPKPAHLIVLQECSVKISVCALRPWLWIAPSASTEATYTIWHDNSSLGYELYSVSHSQGSNELFADGHILYRKANSLLAGDFGLEPAEDTQKANSTTMYKGSFRRHLPRPGPALRSHSQTFFTDDTLCHLGDTFCHAIQWYDDENHRAPHTSHSSHASHSPIRLPTARVQPPRSHKAIQTYSNLFKPKIFFPTPAYHFGLPDARSRNRKLARKATFPGEITRK